VPTSDATSSSWRVHPTVEKLGAYSWRLVGIGIVVWGALQVVSALRLVLLPVFLATLLTVVLSAPAGWMKARGVPTLLATWVAFLGFLGTIVLAGLLIVPGMVEEFSDLGPAVSDGYERVEDWIVEDSPFDVDRERLRELREEAGDALRDAAAGSGGAALEGAVLALEVLAALLLALVLTFFFVKDGARFQRWALGRLPAEHRHKARRVAAGAWRTLGGYLRGSAILGLLEAIIIGGVLWLTGATLVLPVMVLTFAAAFIPLVGAVVAGVIAVAVALATAGPTAALVVAIVAVVVQQLDNDLLAPFIFGKALDLHPVVILLVIASGGTLAGFLGAFVAVPIAAVIANVLAELRTTEPVVDEG
jgi:predicted PurR-regulated permease PerM